MRKSGLSSYKSGKLLEHFVAGTTARCAARLVGVNPKTAAYYFHRLREIIAFYLHQKEAKYFSGEIEVDKSYFGGHRKGKEGVERRAKFLCLACRNAEARFIPK